MWKMAKTKPDLLEVLHQQKDTYNDGYGGD